MTADYRKPYWGGEEDDEWNEKQQKLFCTDKQVKFDEVHRDIFSNIGQQATASEILQCCTGSENRETLPDPKKCGEKVGGN